MGCVRKTNHIDKNKQWKEEYWLLKHNGYSRAIHIYIYMGVHKKLPTENKHSLECARETPHKNKDPPLPQNKNIMG